MEASREKANQTVDSSVRADKTIKAGGPSLFLSPFRFSSSE